MNDTVQLPGPDSQGAQDRRYDVRIAARLAALERELGFSDLAGAVAFLSDQLGLDDIQSALVALDARITALEP